MFIRDSLYFFFYSTSALVGCPSLQFMDFGNTAFGFSEIVVPCLIVYVTRLSFSCHILSSQFLTPLILWYYPEFWNELYLHSYAHDASYIKCFIDLYLGFKRQHLWFSLLVTLSSSIFFLRYIKYDRDANYYGPLFQLVDFVCFQSNTSTSTKVHYWYTLVLT